MEETISDQFSEGSDDRPKLLRAGRKGDPRMHKAVAARLANPEMPLVRALQVGGFSYPDGDDPQSVDADGVTLAQRKNQLYVQLYKTMDDLLVIVSRNIFF